MDEEANAQGRSELWRALQKLTQGRGIQRPDLLEALASELSELQRCWGINLRNGVEVARRTVTANLDAHFKQVTLPKPGPKSSKLSASEYRKRYWMCVTVSFNMLDQPGLFEADISERRKWLRSQIHGKLKAATSTSQRYLNHAIDQIEQQILKSGYQPVRAVTIAPEPPAVPDPAEAGAAPAVEASHPKALNGRIAIVAVSGVLALGGISAYALMPDSHPVADNHGLTGAGSIQPSTTKPLAHPTVTVSAASSTSSSVSPTPPTFKLDVSLREISDGLGGESVIFPTSRLADVAQFAKPQSDPTLTRTPEGSNFLLDELNHGAYLTNGMEVVLHLETPSTQAISIENIELVDVKREPNLTGALIAANEGQGNDDVSQAVMRMNEQNPIPYAVPSPHPEGYPAVHLQRFFQAKNVYVTNGESEGINLDIADGYGAYEFNIKVYYTMEGYHSSVVVSRDGQPFRVAAPECGASPLDTKQEITDLSKIRYQRVSYLDYPNSGPPNFQVTSFTKQMIPQDPNSSIVNSCSTQ